MSNEIITDDGEIIEQIANVPAMVDTTMASALARAEIDTQISTAKRYPRSIKQAMDNIISMATLDQETATECIYALKRGGKPIRGPSIRLAEIISGFWGNCRDAAVVVSIDRVNKIITAEGAFHDLETNRATKSSVQRRLSGRDGRLFSDDMITVTGNAACSIARRNAILAGVPKGIWRKAQEACEQIIRGDVKTLVERREGALKALAHFNLSPDQIFKIMDVSGIEDLNLDDVATLRVIYTSLKNGEQTVEELLRQIEPEKQTRVTAVTASMTAPAHFSSEGLPSVDAAPTQAQSAKPAPAAPIAPAAAETPPAATTSQQATLPIDDEDDGTDAVLETLKNALDRAPNASRIAAVWKGVETMLDSLEPERRVAAEDLRKYALARVKASKPIAAE